MTHLTGVSSAFALPLAPQRFERRTGEAPANIAPRFEGRVRQMWIAQGVVGILLSLFGTWTYMNGQRIVENNQAIVQSMRTLATDPLTKTPESDPAAFQERASENFHRLMGAYYNGVYQYTPDGEVYQALLVETSEAFQEQDTAVMRQFIEQAGQAKTHEERMAYFQNALQALAPEGMETQKEMAIQIAESYAQYYDDLADKLSVTQPLLRFTNSVAATMALLSLLMALAADKPQQPKA